MYKTVHQTAAPLAAAEYPAGVYGRAVQYHGIFPSLFPYQDGGGIFLPHCNTGFGFFSPIFFTEPITALRTEYGHECLQQHFAFALLAGRKTSCVE